MTVMFVTGTDTDAGKTFISSAILWGLTQSKVNTLGYKPIAAGAAIENGSLVNSDAALLAKYSAANVDAGDINPICLAPPIAPHIAAQQAGITICEEDLLTHLNQTIEKHAPEFTLVEGAGGWKVPLDLAGNTLADLPKKQRWPVIMVVGMKLGCLNHALLTADAMISDGVALAGWVANCVDPDMKEQSTNIESLKALLPSPCLGVVPFMAQAEPERAWSYIQSGFARYVKH
ncbi:dethiobiotin synthase [Echinimonas agarilytica]|uniref:ATP-dependent dethiobiotin synthetase BioD n=1 Tax=Echinimonas agarilytica TaxID=1215918 RepID=A0AA41W8Q3_9GAMM|nr:dethiobiotin synthase [Echinimonas agarilytica]MCM2680628.1 dethiobiotin synthase [Echinimonas agarilytica]